MAFITVYEGIVFIEGEREEARPFKSVQVDFSFKFGAQLKSLRDVKSNLAKQARAYGCNAVLNFTYGQKSRWLAIDDVAFFGKGVAALLPQHIYSEIINDCGLS